MCTCTCVYIEEGFCEMCATLHAQSMCILLIHNLYVHALLLQWYLTICTVCMYSVHLYVLSFQHSVIYELWGLLLCYTPYPTHGLPVCMYLQCMHCCSAGHALSLPLAVRVPSANNSSSGGCTKDKVLGELKVKNGRGKLVKVTGESKVSSNGPPGTYVQHVHFGGVYAHKHVGTIVFLHL